MIKLWKRFKYYLREIHSIWYHSQNLNTRTDDHGRTVDRGSMWIEGRAWLHIKSFCIGFSWCTLRKARFTIIGLSLNSGDGNQIQFELGIPWLLTFWLTFESPLFKLIMPGIWTKSYVRPGEMWFMPVEREMGISIHDGIIWFRLWSNPLEWDSRQPWWWEFNFDYVDFILGKSKTETRVVDQGQVNVPMPEGNYLVKYEKLLKINKRPRWFAQKWTAFDLDLLKPIPIPGKGENSWDLDDDAIHNMYCPAATLEEAVGKLIASALRTRRRYGWEYDEPVKHA